MGIASIFESFYIVCNCFFPSRRARTQRQLDIDNQLKDINVRYGVHMIKVEDNFHIKNLYPSTDEVHKWSIFVIGNDFTYIHACIGEFQFPHAKDLLNRKGTNIIPTELNEVFEPIWVQTLNGEQVQMYLIMSHKLYLVNSYPFYNANRTVIGAVMFVRPFVSERTSFDVPKENR